MIIDGQYGSTGKGLIAGWLGRRAKDLDLTVTNAGPNAGHTYVTDGGEEILAFHLPVSGLVSPYKPAMYLSAGCIIDPNVLQQELTKFQKYHATERISVHPRAAIVSDIDRTAEKSEVAGTGFLGSTQKGVGSALARKIMRRARLAADDPNVKHLVMDRPTELDRPETRTIIMEVPQGMDLSLNHGLAYPYCTSREVSVAQALSDLGVHPYALGDVILSIRTLPIRVGHIYDAAGNKIGDSGPFWPDQQELDWKDLGVAPELTTVTKRPRRIFSFSVGQLTAAMVRSRPSIVFINFANYVSGQELQRIQDNVQDIASRYDIPLKGMLAGYGPKDSDVRITHTWKGW